MKMTMRVSAIIGAALLAVSGCAPDSGFNNISDYDVVVTHYDPDADFQAYTTFAVADTLLELGRPEGDDEPLPEALKDLIKEGVETQMLRFGYILENDPQSNAPDLFIVAGVTQTRWTGYVPGYPVYPGYPWGPWYPYYPWYPGWSPGYVYEYDTGTIMIDMYDYATYDEETDEIDIVWTAGINGIISSSSSTNADRITKGIRQAFDQSPYLKLAE